MTDDLAALAAFTAARLDEDEAGASDIHDAGGCSAVEYVPPPDATYHGMGSDDECDCGYPARALREVAVKRARLERYVSAVRAAEKWRTEGGSQTVEIILITLYKEVQHDATVWSDHPDYRQEWAP